METIKYDSSAIAKSLKENQASVRDMVLESYRDMIEGKGRDCKEFFGEMESRYGCQSAM